MTCADYISPLRIGDAYDRPRLAQYWGLGGFQAISRGVYTPAGTNLIFLFVTRVKQRCLTPYQDFLHGEVLQWEGESKHVTDRRIANASVNGDEIHLFYREIHHTPFVYHGRIVMCRFMPHTGRPSEFTFDVVARIPEVAVEDSSAMEVCEEPVDYTAVSDVALNNIDKLVLAKNRGLAQSVFRSNQIKLWNGACAVTGVGDPRVLRASHIKPWKESTLFEKVDRDNGLLLIPDLDALFDEGLITFQPSGDMRISPSFSEENRRKMRVSTDFRLQRVTDGMQPYLEYHRDCRFVS